MASKEARLILSLVDGVSGPARGIVSSLGAVNKTVAGMKNMALMPARVLDTMARDIRRRVSDMTAMSAGLTIGITKAAQQVYELEKQLNISEAAGELNGSQRNQLMKEAIRLNGEYAATSTEIVAGANEVLKAGMSYEQTMGSLVGILDTAQAMDVPIADASAAIVNSMVAQRMEMDNTAQTMKSSIKMADLYAHAVRETTASLEDFTTSGKYFNPVAAAMGMSPDETMAWQIALAKAGIKGSSAGTGLRSAPVSIAAPTKGARAAMAGLGINPQDFVGKRTGGATGDTIAAALESAGFTAEGIEAGIGQLLKDPKIGKSSAKLANAIIAQFGEEMGVQTGQDKSIISDSIQDALMAGVSEVDMIGMLKALRDKGAGIGDYAAIFGKNHASKMMAIDPDEFDKILKKIEESSEGTAKRMRETMMKGIVRDWNEMTAAVESTSVAIGQAGLLGDAAKGLQAMADALNEIATSNPEMLRMGAYAAIALAAMAPLGLVLSGVASSMALLVNPLALVAAVLTYLAVVNWDAITGFFTAFGTVLKDNVNPEILDGVASAITRIKDAFAGLDSTGYNAKWASAAASSGKAAADAINAMYEALKKISSTKYVENFGAGFVAAFHSIGDAANWAVANLNAVGIKLQPIIDLLNSQAGGNLGYMAGQMMAFGAALAIASIGIRLVAGPIRLLGTALGILSGITPAWNLLTFIGRLGSYTAAAAGITSLSTAISGLGTALSFMARIAGGIPALAAFVTYKGLTASGPSDPSLIEPGRGAEKDNYYKQFHGVPFEGGMHRAGRGAGPSPGAMATPQIDTTDVARQAQEAGTIIKNGMSVTATPVINTSGLDAAIAKAGTFRAMLAGTGSVSVGASAPSGPKFGGPRARGGPVKRGLSYLIGEEGPEVMTAGASGFVTPNHALGGGGYSGPLIGNLHIHGANADEVMAKLGRTLNAALSRSRQVGLDGRSNY